MNHVSDPTTFRRGEPIRWCGLTVPQARQIVCELWAALYLIYGVRLAVIIWWDLPYLLFSRGLIRFVPRTQFQLAAGMLNGALFAMLAAGAAWWITGRTLKAHSLSRARLVIWGALAAAAPTLSLAIESSRQLPMLASAFFAALAFGAGMGWAWHAVLCRCRAGSGREVGG